MKKNEQVICIDNQGLENVYKLDTIYEIIDVADNGKFIKTPNYEFFVSSKRFMLTERRNTDNY